MFGSNKEGKPVDVIVVEHTFIDGQLAKAGTRLRQVPADLALELAAAGKVRAAPVEDKKEAA